VLLVHFCGQELGMGGIVLKINFSCSVVHNILWIGIALPRQCPNTKYEEYKGVAREGVSLDRAGRC
jgi:hypothetical protein